MQSLAGETASAGQSRMRRSRPRRRARRFRLPRGWRRVAVLAVAGLALLGLDHLPPGRRLIAAADHLAATSGLGIEQVVVSGYRNVLLDDVFAALAIEKAGSVIGYDIEAARARLEALAWVATAEIARVLPNSLEVRLAERAPAAIWQNRRMLFLIDADGRTLDPIAPSDHPELLVVVGDGAAAAAGPLFRTLARHPDIVRRLQAAVRIADRRWTLKLAGAPELWLPENDLADALDRVARLQAEERLLDRAIAVVDLRLPDRVRLQLTRPAAETPRLIRGGGA